MASFRQEGDVLIPNGDIKFDKDFADHQYIGGVEKLKIVKIVVNENINNMLSVSLEGKEGKEYNLDPNSVNKDYKDEIMDFYKKVAAPVKEPEPVKEPAKDVYKDKIYYAGDIHSWLKITADNIARKEGTPPLPPLLISKDPDKLQEMMKKRKLSQDSFVDYSKLSNRDKEALLSYKRLNDIDLEKNGFIEIENNAEEHKEFEEKVDGLWGYLLMKEIEKYQGVKKVGSSRDSYIYGAEILKEKAKIEKSSKTEENVRPQQNSSKPVQSSKQVVSEAVVTSRGQGSQKLSANDLKTLEFLKEMIIKEKVALREQETLFDKEVSVIAEEINHLNKKDKDKVAYELNNLVAIQRDSHEHDECCLKVLDEVLKQKDLDTRKLEEIEVKANQFKSHNLDEHDTMQKNIQKINEVIKIAQKTPQTAKVVSDQRSR